MRASKELSIVMVCLFFVSLILSYLDLLLIDELTILRAQLIFLAFWSPMANFLSGYPLDVLILISLTLIIFYILRILGIKIH